MLITGYTTFFKDKWSKVYNEVPTVDFLNDSLQKSAIRIQPYMVFFDKKKNDLVKVLASYWIPEENLVVKVDVESKSCVTFYCIDDLKNK